MVASTLAGACSVFAAVWARRGAVTRCHLPSQWRCLAQPLTFTVGPAAQVGPVNKHPASSDLSIVPPLLTPANAR